MADLNHRIRNEADILKQNLQMPRRAVRDMIRRTQDCVRNDGRQVKD